MIIPSDVALAGIDGRPGGRLDARHGAGTILYHQVVLAAGWSNESPHHP